MSFFESEKATYVAISLPKHCLMLLLVHSVITDLQPTILFIDLYEWWC